MPGSIFGIPSRPTSGQGVIWQETLGGRMDTGALAQTASGLSGLTLNRVPFGNSLGGLQDSANLTFDGTTVTHAGTTAGSFTTAGGYTSTVATGTAPFTATSTTACPNLNASLLLGGTWAIPGTIGSTTPNTGAFTTISATSGITSTLTTGNLLVATGASTGFKSVHLSNTSGEVYLGVESSVGGNAFTGSAAYDAVVYSPNRLYLAGFAGMKLGGSGDIVITSGLAFQLGNGYVATPQVTTGYVTIKDSNGTTYKVLVAT